jgi:Fe2+ or Zn2+ uptake regulation protein
MPPVRACASAVNGAWSSICCGARKSHLSARDIFEKLNVQGRSIGHTSVYQNLEALQSAGVIECLDRANGRFVWLPQ